MLRSAAKVFPLNYDFRRGPVDGALLHGFLPFEEDLEQALLLDPYSADMLLNLTLIKLTSGRPLEARAVFDRAVALRPKFSRLDELRRIPVEPATTD